MDRKGTNFSRVFRRHYSSEDCVYLPQCFIQKFLFADPLWLRKIITGPHIFIHVNYYTIWMSLVTALFRPVPLLNQRCPPPLRLQAPHCSLNFSLSFSLLFQWLQLLLVHSYISGSTFIASLHTNYHNHNHHHLLLLLLLSSSSLSSSSLLLLKGPRSQLSLLNSNILILLGIYFSAFNLKMA